MFVKKAVYFELSLLGLFKISKYVLDFLIFYLNILLNKEVSLINIYKYIFLDLFWSEAVCA